MIDFYFHPTPTPAKVALFLEETEMADKVLPVDTGKGEQHTAAFRATKLDRFASAASRNPNTKSLRINEICLVRKADKPHRMTSEQNLRCKQRTVRSAQEKRPGEECCMSTSLGFP